MSHCDERDSCIRTTTSNNYHFLLKASISCLRSSNKKIKSFFLKRRKAPEPRAVWKITVAFLGSTPLQILSATANLHPASLDHFLSKSNITWWFNWVCNGSKNEAGIQSVVTDNRYLTSDFWPEKFAKRVFLAKMSVTLQTSQDTLVSGHMVRCATVLWGIKVSPNLWRKLQKSIWLKVKLSDIREDRLPIGSRPLWIRPGGYLTTHAIYCEGSLTADQGSLSHGHLKNNPTNWSITPAHRFWPISQERHPSENSGRMIQKTPVVYLKHWVI